MPTRVQAHTGLTLVTALAVCLGLIGCSTQSTGKIAGGLAALAPPDQLFSSYGGDADVLVPTTYRDGGNPFPQRKQSWHFKYLGSWEKDMPDPPGWSPFVKPGPQLQPGEVKKVVNGVPMVCGNKANDALHPMDDYYFVLTSNRVAIRNARPTDFGCDQSYQDLWNHLDNVPGLKAGQKVLHSYCMVDFLGNVTRLGFKPKGPFKCRFILSAYKSGNADLADIQVTVYTETDTPLKNMDDAQLNITIKAAALRLPH